MVSPYGKDIVKTVFDRSDEAHEGIDFDAVPFVFLSDGFQKFLAHTHGFSRESL